MEFNIAILEEASIIPQSVMESFAPCLGVNYAVFIAITTALDEDNYISVLFNNADEQAQHLFTRIHVELWVFLLIVFAFSSNPQLKNSVVNASQKENRLRTA